MKLYLLRHGESEANVAGVINDDPGKSVILTARGQNQARVAAAGLAGISFAAVYASRFPRARQTAELILQSLSLPQDVIVDAGLDERRSGLDGQPVEAFNGLVRTDVLYARPACGETFVEQMQRVRSFMDVLAHRYPPDTEVNILAVSHENPIQAALACVEEDEAAWLRIAHTLIPNCAWRVLNWPPGKRFSLGAESSTPEPCRQVLL